MISEILKGKHGDNSKNEMEKLAENNEKVKKLVEKIKEEDKKKNDKALLIIKEIPDCSIFFASVVLSWFSQDTQKAIDFLKDKDKRSDIIYRLLDKNAYEEFFTIRNQTFQRTDWEILLTIDHFKKERKYNIVDVILELTD